MDMGDDIVQTYARHRQWDVAAYNVLVEGITDYEFFLKAAQEHLDVTGEDLFRNGLRILPAGHRQRGGTHGVVRELTVTRNLGECAVTQKGLRRYRFVGLVDDDVAGRQAVSGARYTDTSVVEYRDIFRLRPEMVCRGVRDAEELQAEDVEELQAEFEKQNRAYKGLDWELEDLLRVGFVETFCSRSPQALRGRHEVSGRVHWEFTRTGKGELRRFVKENAKEGDLRGVVRAIKSLRFCLGLK